MIGYFSTYYNFPFFLIHHMQLCFFRKNPAHYKIESRANYSDLVMCVRVCNTSFSILKSVTRLQTQFSSLYRFWFDNFGQRNRVWAIVSWFCVC